MDFGVKAYYGSGFTCTGDSYTGGVSASTPNNSYHARLANYLGSAENNLGLSGSGTNYAANSVFTLPILRKSVLTVLSGLNDVNKPVINSQTMSKIENNYRSIIAAAFLKEAFPASAAGAHGSWSPLSSTAGGKAINLNGTGLYTTDINAYLQYYFSGETLVVGSMSTVPDGGECQNFYVSIDNGTPREVSVTGLTNQSYTYVASVFKNLGPGPHVAKIYPKNSANWTVIDYVGTLSEPGANGPLFIGEIPYLKVWNYNGSTLTPAIVDSANAIIRSVVAEFSEWPVCTVPTNSFYEPTTSTISDGLHPNDDGHYQIFQAFKSKISLWA